MAGGPCRGPAATVTIDIIGDREERRVVLRCRDAVIEIALCDCPPRDAAIELSSVLQWAWGFAVDDTFPSLMAALRGEVAA
jgi:hypothetical protein